MRSRAEVVFAFAGIVLIMCMLIVLMVLLYVAYFRMSEILGCLRNSPAAIIRKEMLGYDPIGRYLAIINIAAILVFPGRSVRNGDLDLHDYLSFPTRLKNIVCVPFLAMLILAVISMGFIFFR